MAGETGMMSLTDGVRTLARSFVENKPQYVSIDEGAIKFVAEEIVKEKEKLTKKIPYPEWITTHMETQEHKDIALFMYELLAGSINYNYWFGKHDVRHYGASSNMMYELLDKSCIETIETFPKCRTFHRIITELVPIFIKKLILYRFPNIEKRIKHLEEVQYGFVSHDYRYVTEKIKNKEMSLEAFLKNVVTIFPGYAGDMFLKRAFLLATMLYRRTGWFEDDIKDLPIPADYQIPKMLKWFAVLDYSADLDAAIRLNALIPSGSMYEIEIRASSIRACELLAEAADVNMCDVDTFLWYNRKNCEWPFHLTITTDY